MLTRTPPNRAPQSTRTIHRITLRKTRIPIVAARLIRRLRARRPGVNRGRGTQPVSFFLRAAARWRRSSSRARAAALIAASRSRSARRWARSLLTRCSQRRHPVAEQGGPGVAGLLRVELGRAQRTVLHRGDEAVLL